VDALERRGHVVDCEVGQRAGVAGPGATLVHAEPQAARIGFPARPGSRPSRRQLDPQQSAPEAQGALRIIGGELDQRRRYATQPSRLS
jgi:hypothetical protein